MTNPLQYLEKYPERAKQILGIEYQQWLALVEVAKFEEERIQLAREQQKSGNKVISSQRIYVEHVIRLLKIFRAAQEKFRMKGNKYEQVILTICGLVRLRIGALILPDLNC